MKLEDCRICCSVRMRVLSLIHMLPVQVAYSSYRQHSTLLLLILPLFKETMLFVELRKIRTLSGQSTEHSSDRYMSVRTTGTALP